MSGKFFTVFILLLILVLVIGGGIYWWLKSSTQNPYVAVYLETGDMYFGKISYFPKLSLREVYTVQTVPDPTNPLGGNNLQVVPLKTSVWSPDNLVLNPQKVVFIGKVGEDSQVMTIIRQGQ